MSDSSTQVCYSIDRYENKITVRPRLSEKDWETIFGVMKELHITNLDAGGQMTDAALKRLAEVDHVMELSLAGSKCLTDQGLQHLTKMPGLRALDLGGWENPITDRGLDALRPLGELRRLQVCWAQHVSDVGMANLAFCDHLESVDLMGTPTGDGAIAALRGKESLRRFKSGTQVTDAGLALLHEFPAFKTWQGGELRYALMSPNAGPTHLMVDGPITDKGLASMVGLDGLFGFSALWHCSALTSDGLLALAELPNLGFLGYDGKLCTDLAMTRIAALPRLRMLMAQGAVAGDAGFDALSRSQTIEYIWGRECPNLTGRGFAALAAMPALRGVAISCTNVDDAALATLPRFPALREFMPMDVPDEGFIHVGRCQDLEALWCMYCRNTGDPATSQIAGLSRLKSYYAGATQITDQSLEILASMESLEIIEFDKCAAITSAGVARLAGLPHLRQLTIGGSPNVNRDSLTVFPAEVRIHHRS